MKAKARNLDVVHHGFVTTTFDGSQAIASRLLLTKDHLTIKVAQDENAEKEERISDSSVRTVIIKKKGGGIGLSIKGGTENSQNLPIVISKIFPGMPADLTGQLFVGDAIVEVNGVCVEGKSHDEVVEMVKGGDEVRLGVRYNNIAPYMRPAQSLQPARSGSTINTMDGKAMSKAQSDLGLYDGKDSLKEDKWRTVASIALPMAYVTRYLWGTDHLRQGAFEVRAVDGTTTGVVHCENEKATQLWLSHIHNHIMSLNQKSIKMSNKYLHQSEQITFISWVNERMAECSDDDPKQMWQARFLILKGGDVCLFETPPLNSDDLNNCLHLYKCYDVALKQVPNDSRRLDKRENCMWLETSSNIRHYLSFDTPQLAQIFDSTFNKCVYNTVTAMQTRTFACCFEGRPCGLVFDIRQGISLYDIPTKTYVWQYRFHDLHSSVDDGKVHVQFIFNDRRSMNADRKEVKDVESDEVVTIAFNLHSFLLAKILAADPEFLKQNPLL